MFTQNCCIKKNTKELRDKLKSLGYKLNHVKARGKYLICFKTDDTDEYVFVASPEWDLNNMPCFTAIDCGTNEALFLAIAALRDDSDYIQWFICNETGEWYCHKPLSEYGDKDDAYTILKKDKWHKATVEELIEHFKAE